MRTHAPLLSRLRLLFATEIQDGHSGRMGK